MLTPRTRRPGRERSLSVDGTDQEAEDALINGEC
jgi:hypothetical protein